jgi:glucose-1-phosphate thymidylyltransferase
MAIVGVVPAAGYALRLQPLDCSKEMLPVAGRPVIDYLVERMRVGGATEVRVVARPEKDDVVAYAEEVGSALVLGHPAHLAESLAAGLKGLADDDIALIGFPDSLWEPLDGYRTLVTAVKGGHEVALGMFRAPGLVGSDFLALDDAGEIAHIEIKPALPPSDWIWGAAAARARALRGLERVEWPSQHMNSLIRQGRPPLGVRLSSEYLDIGTPESLEVLAASRWVA